VAQTLTASKDTMVRGDDPNRSDFGGKDTMRVDDGARRSATSSSRPESTGNAKLRLYATGADRLPFDVHVVVAGWPANVTHGNRPALGAKVGSGTVVPIGWAG
jgi:hypothetical protein